MKLTEQENHYQKQLALALSRLRGIEYVMNTIAAAGISPSLPFCLVSTHIPCTTELLQSTKAQRQCMCDKTV